MNEKVLSELELSESEVAFLLSPEAIRDRAEKVFLATKRGEGAFRFHGDKFDSTVDFVLDVIKKNYPKGDIPFHSRWGHFRAGGVDRVTGLAPHLEGMGPIERARTLLDLVITSVLLDAGAGAAWKYREAGADGSVGGFFGGRSEGLGVASFYMFTAGAMSTSDLEPLRADGEKLRALTAADLRHHFQVSEANPLVGVEGRVALLNELGRVVKTSPIFAGHERPGAIVDYLIDQHGSSFTAKDVLQAVLLGLGPIWPGRLAARGVNLGDVWRHSKLGHGSEFESLVPIHKLSQWLTYSLLEPMMDAGLKISGVEELTGLAEYRNGGLLLDSGLLSLANPADAAKEWRPDSDLIIEWRALTVALLDRIGAEVQNRLGKSAQEFPLAKVLEGGTWWAGRFLAKAKRPESGDPPLRIVSDGTVF